MMKADGDEGDDRENFGYSKVACNREEAVEPQALGFTIRRMNVSRKTNLHHSFATPAPRNTEPIY